MEIVTDLIPHRPPFLFIDEIVSQNAGRPRGAPHLARGRGFLSRALSGRADHAGRAVVRSGVSGRGCYMALKARAAGLKPGEGVPLIAKINDVRFRTPIIPATPCCSR
jgi:3-hydroxyacyl-[acyl-carrier-protein] dehydratase